LKLPEIRAGNHRQLPLALDRCHYMSESSDAGTISATAANLDKAIRLYTELGYTAERTAAQLVRSGYPLALIRDRFPQLPAAAIPESLAPRTQRKFATALLNTSTNAPGVGVPKFIETASLLSRVPTEQRTPTLPTYNVQTTESTDGIAFQYVPLIQCSFPHADQGELTTFTRRNGWLELTLSTARRDTGLPYGVPARLLTIYCASEAIRTRSPEIYLGKSVHEFLRRLEVPITRGERGSLRVYANQLLRLIHCAISIDENIRDATGRTGLHIRQALFAEEAQLWWDDRESIGQGSSLVLSSVLFQSILERSAPLSTHAIRQLRKSPMDLDIYAWLVHRLFHLSRPSTLTWEQLSGQFGHSYGELRYFRRFFGDSLKRVLKVYPEARLDWLDTGIVLLPSRRHVSSRRSPRA
jgi:Plasmid encoded RepA protein